MGWTDSGLVYRIPYSVLKIKSKKCWQKGQGTHAFQRLPIEQVLRLSIACLFSPQTKIVKEQSIVSLPFLYAGLKFPLPLFYPQLHLKRTSFKTPNGHRSHSSQILTPLALPTFYISHFFTMTTSLPPLQPRLSSHPPPLPLNRRLHPLLIPQLNSERKAAIFR